MIWPHPPRSPRSPRPLAVRMGVVTAIAFAAAACGAGSRPPRAGGNERASAAGQPEGLADQPSAETEDGSRALGAPAASSAATSDRSTKSESPAAAATPLLARPAKPAFVVDLVDRSEPRHLAPTPEGGVFVLGETAWGYTFKDDLFFARLDPSGKTETLVLGTGRYGRDLAATKEAVFFSTELTGAVRYGDAVVPTTGGDTDLFIGKTDPQGKLLWGKMIGTPSYDREGYLAPTTDGGVVVAHSAFSSRKDGPIVFTPAGGADTLVSRFEADGSKRWTRFFGGTGYDQPSGVVLAPSGEIFVAGTRWRSKDEWASALADNVCEGFVMRLSPEGEVRWNVGLGGFGGHTVTQSLRLTPDGTLLVRGTARFPVKLGAFAIAVESEGKSEGKSKGKGESAIVATLSQDGAITSARTESKAACSVVHPSGATLRVTVDGVFHEDTKGTQTAIAAFVPKLAQVYACALAGPSRLYVSGQAEPNATIAGVKVAPPVQPRTKTYLPTYAVGFVAGLDL